MTKEWKTRQSLVLRAKDPSDEEAWSDFIRYYELFIYYLLHRMEIDNDDLEDLKQVILLKLWKSLQSYDVRKGKFRSWMAILVRNAVYDFYRTAKRRGQIVDSGELIQGERIAADQTDLERMIEEEWEIYMTSYAFERLSRIFSETAIRVFELSLEGRSAKEIAKQLNIGVDSVYTLRNRVKSRLVNEVNAIMQEVEM